MFYLGSPNAQKHEARTAVPIGVAEPLRFQRITILSIRQIRETKSTPSHSMARHTHSIFLITAEKDTMCFLLTSKAEQSGHNQESSSDVIRTKHVEVTISERTLCDQKCNDTLSNSEIRIHPCSLFGELIFK